MAERGLCGVDSALADFVEPFHGDGGGGKGRRSGRGNPIDGDAPGTGSLEGSVQLAAREKLAVGTEDKRDGMGRSGMGVMKWKMVRARE